MIAILSVLIGLLLPAVQGAREAARRAHCVSNLKQIGLALLNYHDVVGTLPMGYAGQRKFVNGVSDVRQGWAWGTMVLPQLEQGSLFNAVNFSQPVESPGNATAIPTLVKTFLCPSDSADGPFPVSDASGNVLATLAPSSYAACVGGDESDTITGLNQDGCGTGVMYRNSAIRLADITDGTSGTILVGERAWSISQGTWVGIVRNGVVRRGPADRCPLTGALFYQAPTLVQAHAHLLNTDTDADGGLDDFSSRHPGGANFVFSDGSVRFLKDVLRDLGTLPNGQPIYSPASLRLQALATRSRGEIVNRDAD